MLTFEQIKELIELAARHRLQSLEVERSGFRLKIDGQSQGQPAVYALPAEAPAPAPASPGALPAMPAMPAMAAMAATPPSAAPAAPAAAASATDGAHIVTSPIVGTFYRASSPDAEPFTEVGARVKKGQVLCIIEAMKLMNDIESDADGTVVRIFPQNAQPVEFGEPLFAVQPD